MLQQIQQERDAKLFVKVQQIPILLFFSFAILQFKMFFPCDF